MRNQTMYRTCLLTAALLLTGCSEPKRDPLMIGSEVFLNSTGEYDLLQKHIAVTEGTKLRIVAFPGTIFRTGKERPETIRVLVLEGKHTGELLEIKPNHVFFAP